MTAGRRLLRYVALGLAAVQMLGTAVAPWLDGAAVARTRLEANADARSHATQSHLDKATPEHDPSTCATCQLISMASLLPLAEHGPRAVADVASNPISRDVTRPTPLARQGFLSRAPPVLPA